MDERPCEKDTTPIPPNEGYELRWASVSAEVPDWNRERINCYWDPGKRLLASIRSYQYWRSRYGLLAASMRRIAVLRHVFWSVVTGADIPLNTTIGGGLGLTHSNGIVIHPDSIIGINCLIFQQVTIGTGGKKPGVPMIGGHVDIGTGAKILGGVRIGNCVRIGANAVVLDDVPDNCTAVGIPARIIRHNACGDPMNNHVVIDHG